MERRLSEMLGWLLALGLCSCGGGKPSHEALTNDYIQTVNRTAEALAGVRDAKTAQTTAPRLKELVAALQENKRATEKLGAPPEDLQKSLKDKYEKKLLDAMNKLLAQEERLAGIPEAQAPVYEALKLLPK